MNRTLPTDDDALLRGDSLLRAALRHDIIAARDLLKHTCYVRQLRMLTQLQFCDAVLVEQSKHDDRILL